MATKRLRRKSANYKSPPKNNNKPDGKKEKKMKIEAEQVNNSWEEENEKESIGDMGDIIMAGTSSPQTKKRGISDLSLSEDAGGSPDIETILLKNKEKREARKKKRTEKKTMRQIVREKYEQDARINFMDSKNIKFEIDPISYDDVAVMDGQVKEYRPSYRELFCVDPQEGKYGLWMVLCFRGTLPFSDTIYWMEEYLSSKSYKEVEMTSSSMPFGAQTNIIRVAFTKEEEANTFTNNSHRFEVAFLPKDIKFRKDLGITVYFHPESLHHEL